MNSIGLLFFGWGIGITTINFCWLFKVYIERKFGSSNGGEENG